MVLVDPMSSALLICLRDGALSYLRTTIIAKFVTSVRSSFFSIEEERSNNKYTQQGYLILGFIIH